MKNSDLPALRRHCLKTTCAAFVLFMLIWFLPGTAMAQPSIFMENFESGGLGAFTNSGTQGSLTWVNTGIRGGDPGHSASLSAYFGNPADTSYNTGSVEGAVITTGAINLSPYGSVRMSFNYYLQTENSPGYDIAEVQVSTDNILFNAIADNQPLLGNIMDGTPNWNQLDLDLTAYAGFPTVYIRISFNTVDAAGNNFEGFFIDDIRLYDPTIIDFSLFPATGCTPSLVTFTNYTTNPSAYIYQWNFGDGPPVQDTNTISINHTFVNSGSYVVQMKVFDSFMTQIGVTTKTVVASGLSSYDQLNLSPLNACPGEPVSFSAPWGYQTYVYDKGDGSPKDTLQNNWVSYQYAAAGSYVASVTILNVCGGTDTTLYDTVNISTTQSFPTWVSVSSWPSPACPNEKVTFNGPWGFATYIWDFGDGTIDTTTSANRNHKFLAEGTYPVSLRVFNFCGNDTVLNMTQVIRYTPFPPMTLYANPTPACPGQTISLSAPWGYVSYAWDFGDGTPVDTNAVAYMNHVYAATGAYTASVTLTQLCGNDTTIYANVNINSYVAFPSPMSIYTYPNPACPYQSIYFSGYWGYPSYRWNFGDGSPAQTTTTANTNHVYTSAGTYSASLKMTNLCGNDTTIYKTVTISSSLPFPLLSYSPGANPTCPGNVTFNATNGFQFYTWKFGDGSPQQTTSTNTMTHNYPNLGTYFVSLKMVNYCGDDTTLYDTLVVRYAPFPSMYVNHNPVKACPNENVNFNASWGYVSYKWNFGDGTKTTGSSYISHKYGNVGVYIVSVKVKQLCGNDTILYDTVRVVNNQHIPTLVSLSEYPDPACPGEEINLYGPWGFASYIWDFGDGNQDTTTNSYLTYNYPAAGDYQLSLTVSNFCGLDTTIYDSLKINGSMRIPNGINLNVWYQNGGLSACPTEMVNMDGPWGFPSYVWNYGDGTPSDSGSFQTMSHAYASAGTYTVGLTVTNYCGMDTTLYKPVVINDNKPFGMLSLYTGMGSPWCPGEQVSFQAAQGFAAYVWNYGDGTPLDSTTAKNVKHSFAGSGSYTVSVKFIDYCGSDTTLSTAVTIDDNVSIWATIYIYPNPICPDQVVNFTTDTSNVSYFWDFGDGFAAYGSAEANHSYSALGDYEVAVTITNHCGNDSTFTSTVTVDTTTSFPSWMNYWIEPWEVCPGELVTLRTEKGFNNYFWDFGDGDTVTTTGPSIQHSYDIEGSYNATVTITNGCGNSTTLPQSSIMVNVNEDSEVQAPQIKTQFNAYCPGDDVMFLLSSWGAGWQNYTYIWDYGDGDVDTTVGVGATHRFAAIGNYTTSVTIMNSCGDAAMVPVPIKIINNAVPKLNENNFGTLASTNSVGCPGDAVVFYFEGSSDNMWDFGDGSSGEATEQFMNEDGVTMTVIKHAYSAAGSYVVKLTLTNSCGNSAEDSIVISINSNLLVDGGLILEPPATTGRYTTCSSINMIAYGGSSYNWDFGDGGTLTTISPSISHVFSSAGNYSISVTITNGCGNSTTFSQSVNIEESDGISLNPSVIADVTCFGGSNGSALVAASGGLSPYQYAWDDDNEQTSASAGSLSAGMYAVTVTDALGCSADTSIAIDEAPEVMLSTSSVNSTCGTADGIALVSISSGGVSPFTYLWSSGGSAATETSLESGSYEVTVTDADGCASTAIAAVSDATGPSLTISAVTNATCYADDDGALTVSASGGTAPYTYAWSNGSSTAAITGLIAGNYIVSVTDASTCLSVVIGSVSEPDPLDASFAVVQGECGESTGSATVSATGGTPGYFYQWDSNAGSQVTVTATGLAANAYQVTITDAASCTHTATVTVGNSNSPSLSVNATDVSCFGADDGSIDLSVAGGTTPYVYLWTWTGGSSFVQDLTGLGAGDYTVMVQDGSDCWIGTSVEITEPQLSAVLTITNSGCIGGNNGAASVTVSSGYEPYTYLWSTADTTPLITGLIAGTYTLAITDSNGCAINDTAVIADPDPIGTAITATDVSCFGGSDGEADLAVSGGSEPYTYLWDDPGASTTSAVSVLNANTYTVLITDSCGVTAVDSVTITQPNLLTVTIASTDVNCYGGGDGTATATPSGGTVPYNYVWNNGQTTATAVGLFPGVHAINVFDLNGCIGSRNVTIYQPGLLTLSSVASDATCYGGSDGTVTLSLSGGTAPYLYSWSNGDSTQNLTGVTSGSYAVTVTDSCGASAVSSATVLEPAAPASAIASVDVSCNGANDASVDLVVTGGTEPYTYLWSTLATTEDISGLSPGTYTVDITDACGLVLADTATVSEPQVLSVAIASTDVTCNGAGDGTATATPSGGTAPFNYVWNNGQSVAAAVGLFPGLHTVNVFDANGCLGSNNVTITQPALLSVSVSVTGASCYGGADGTVTLSQSGGASPYTYIWSNGDTSANLSNAAAGSYSITVTDLCGSVVSATATVSEPAAPSISLASVDVSCNAGNDGSIDLSVSGGTAPYMYLWSTLAVTQDISGLSANTYTVDVTDACGLALADTVVVSEPVQLTTTITGVNATCYSYGDGSATVTASGGTTPYNYQWNNGQVTSTAIGLFPGSYSVNVLDDNGCLASTLIAITQPAALAVNIAAIEATCSSADGSATATVTGGTSPYTYAWDDPGSQTNAAAATLTAGTYSLDVTDANGCTETSSVDVEITVETPQICLVDVDSATNKYVVVWEKTGIPVDAYNIYRETSTTGIYAMIGTQAYGVQSDFIDQTSYPEVKSELYRISAMDACGNESALSDYHRSLHLITTPALGNDVALSWDNYIGFSYVKYRIWRGGTQNGMTLLDSVSSSITNYTDTMPPSLDSLFYRIEVIHPSGCLAQKTKNYNSSKSNTSSMSTASDLSVSVSADDASAGNCDGQVTASVSGGDTPYTYLWSDSSAQTTATATGLCPGAYIVIVVDANGDSTTTTGYVGQAGVTITATTSVTAANSGTCDGIATVSASGGTAPYTYVWDGNTGNQVTPTATGLCAGTYSVVVTDSYGNQTTVFASINELVGILELDEEGSPLAVYPNPYSGHTKIAYTLNQDAKVALDVYNIIGEKVDVLADEEQIAGEHAYSFGAANFGRQPGIYLVRLSVNGESYIQRLVELR